MTNTEKPSTKAEQKKTVIAQPKTKKQDIKTPVKKVEENKNAKTEEVKKIEEKVKTPSKEKKTESKPKNKKDTTPKIKKDFVVVNGKSLPVWTKYAKYICKFIKNKSIPKAIEDLEEVSKLKKAVPMQGEIPHRKGQMMSGRFPARASVHFIMLLKSLQGNANMHEIENPFVYEAIANLAQRPFARGGIKRKRTHIMLKAMDKKKLKNKNKEKKK